MDGRKILKSRPGRRNLFAVLVCLNMLVLTADVADAADPNLVSWWKFDEGSGTTAYDTASDNDGTINGATWTTGQIDGALDFDGSGDYVEVNNPADGSLDFGSGNFTISLWFKTTDTDGELIDKSGGGGGRSEGYSLTIGTFGTANDGKIGLRLRDGSRRDVIRTQGAYNDGKWHHVAAVRTGSWAWNLNIYVDGVDVDTATLKNQGAGDISNSYDLSIGAKYDGGDTNTWENFLAGAIDEVMIFDGALSSEEILQLYREGGGRDKWEAGPDMDLSIQGSPSNPYQEWSYKDFPDAWCNPPAPHVLFEYDSGTTGKTHNCPGWIHPEASEWQSLFPITNSCNGGFAGAQADDFAGHGPWMLEWTSPIDGWITISGYMWQAFQPEKQMRWKLAKNCDLFTEGAMPQDAGGTICGLGGKTYFYEGSCGSHALVQQVTVGDKIQLGVTSTITAPYPGTTQVVVRFVIEQIEEPNYPIRSCDPTIAGDINGDYHVNIEDLAELVMLWLEADCILDNFYCGGTDIDESGKVDFTDYSEMGSNWLENIAALHNLGYIVVSPGGPHDGGDFGRCTFGTRTSGFQEAFDFAQENGKDVYIIGSTSYDFHETVHIPRLENFRLDGGEYGAVYHPSSGDAIVIDSQKNCRLKFGLIMAHNLTDPNASVIRIKPSTPGPDGLSIFTASTFDCIGVVGGGEVFPVPGGDRIGIGLYLDASEGAISANKFYCAEISVCDIGVYLSAPSEYTIIDNWIDVHGNHVCDTAHFQVGDVGSTDRVICNRIKSGINGAAMYGSVGVRILGARNNIFELNSIPTPTSGDLDKDIIFEADARDNLIIALHLPHGITNNATHPTNLVIPAKPVGFNVTTPTFPTSGADLQNRSSYMVAATITSAGTVSSWMLTDTSGLTQTVNAGLYTGQLIYLEPGEKVNFTHTSAPTWRWQALR